MIPLIVNLNFFIKIYYNFEYMEIIRDEKEINYLLSNILNSIERN